MADAPSYEVTIDRHSLGILLEYAYRGEAAQGGSCWRDRIEACAMCDALTAAEIALGDDAPAIRQWWSPTIREHVRRVIRLVVDK